MQPLTLLYNYDNKLEIVIYAINGRKYGKLQTNVKFVGLAEGEYAISLALSRLLRYCIVTSKISFPVEKRGNISSGFHTKVDLTIVERSHQDLSNLMKLEDI